MRMNLHLLLCSWCKRANVILVRTLYSLFPSSNIEIEEEIEHPKPWDIPQYIPTKQGRYGGLHTGSTR